MNLKTLNTTMMMSTLLCFGAVACGSDTTEPGTTSEQSSSVENTAASPEDGDARQTPPQNSIVELAVNGMTREYRLYVPTHEPGGSMPLVVAAHGADGRDYPFP